MSKTRNSSQFSGRNAIVLFGSDNRGLPGGGILVGSILDEFKSKTGVSPEVVRLDTLDMDGTDRDAGTASLLLAAAHRMASATKPTIVVVPAQAMLDESPDAAMLGCYIRMLTAASGGFILNAGAGVTAEHMVCPNSIVPEINFNTVRDSWSDLQPRLDSIIEKMSRKENMLFYNMVSTIGVRVRRSNLGVCLGDISRMWVDFPDKSTSPELIINLSGEIDSPIGIGEFSERIWCNPSVPAFHPDRTLIARNPSSFSRMAIGKILANNVNAENLMVINV